MKILIPIILLLASSLILIGLASAEQLNLGAETNKSYDVMKNSLFDIFVTIPQNYETVVPGSELLVNVKLINLGSGGRIDVLMNYEINNSQGAILTKKETVAVETQANFVRTFVIPKDAPLGKYKVYVKLIYADGKEAAAEASFEIVKSADQKNNSYILYGAIAIILLAILTFLGIKSKAIIEKIKMKLKIRNIVKKKLGKS